MDLKLNYIKCIITFLSYNIMLMQKNVLILKRCMSKYLEMKYYDVCNLSKDQSKREKGSVYMHTTQIQQNIKNCRIQVKGLHYARFNFSVKKTSESFHHVRKMKQKNDN